jgi:hypothetical protein
MLGVEVMTGEVAAVFEPVFAASGFDQDSAHGLGRGGEEVPAAVPAVPIASPDQPEIRLIDEGGRLQGVVGGLARHLRGSELPQFVVNERKQFGGSLAAAAGNKLEKSR